MKKIITIGEALIDFIPNKKGCSLKEVVGFERVAGGAPANVAAVVSKLGGKSNFISQLGEDAFGDYIIDELNKVNVDTSYVLRTNKANTGLAFVSLKEDGNRDFSFYRNPSADMLLNESEINKEWFNDCHSLHFCSVDLIDCPMKEAHKKAIDCAIDNNSIISFDPNVRLPLWETPEACRKAILEFLPLANIVKISDEELEFITGISDEPKALEFLLQGDVEVIIYTKGTNGAEFITKERKVFSPSFRVQAQDTTGAGDSFIGSFLYQVAEDDNTLESLVNLSEEKIKEILTFSNATAALTVCKRGAIGALPTKEEVLALAQGR